VLLATELVSHGGTVTIIDADPNRPLKRWSNLPGKPEKLEVIEVASEDSIIDTIETAARKTAFVVVDLEGTASMMAGFAMSRADLVIIPSQGSNLDATEGVKAIKLIQNQEQAFQKKIPFAILFTRTSPAIRTRGMQMIEAEFSQRGAPMFGVQVHEREAYKSLFAYGGTLSDLDPAQVANLAAAQKNATQFAGEVIEILKASSPNTAKQQEEMA